MLDNNLSLAHTQWNCKYHVVFAPKYRRKVFYGIKTIRNRTNTKKIEEYIRNQLKQDEQDMQLSIDFEADPFNGYE